MPSSQPHGLNLSIRKRMRRVVLALSILAAGGLIALYWASTVRTSESQFQTWITWAPEALLSSLIESDDFGAGRYLKSVESSRLFSSFHIYDLNGRHVGGFGPETRESKTLIKDKVDTTWGSMTYVRDHRELIRLTLMLGAVLTIFLLLALHMGVKTVGAGIDEELNPLNHLIQEIGSIFDRLSFLESQDEPHALLKGRAQTAGSTQEVLISQLFSKVVEQLAEYRQRIARYASEQEALKRTEEFALIASQVAHDIRSPLSALRILSQVLGVDMAENKRALLNSSIKRITEISDDLIDGGLVQKVQACELAPLISAIADEKRIELWKNAGLRIEIENAAERATVIVRVADLKRILSNLINNAAEAMNFKGNIAIRTRILDQNVHIEIADDGPGFSAEILPRLFQKGATANKANGNGLGLFHAREELAKWGGTAAAFNAEQGGGVVRLSFNAAGGQESANV